MGVTEIPSQSSETIKIPTAQYEFGANFMDPKVNCYYRSASWNIILPLSLMRLSFHDDVNISSNYILAADAIGKSFDRWETKCKSQMGLHG